MMIQRVSWNRLHDVVLTRHPCIQSLYDKQRENILTQYHTYSDFIKINYMNFGVKSKQGKIYSAKQPNSKDIVFTRNIYPYHLWRNIHHYVIWSLNPMSKRVIDTYMKDSVIKYYDIKEYKIIINDKSRCSVPDLWHCHVFWK
jgi:hypothetical protein